MGAVQVFLETERLMLRRLTADDADLLFALDNDSEVMRFVNGGLPVARAEIVDDYLPAFLSYYERYEAYGFWAAVEKASGRFLGWFHLRPSPDDGPLEPELGYRLHRFAWGQGLATEGSRALIDKGFTGLGVERVHATTMANNVASRRVMEKVGLRYIRTFPADGPFRIPGNDHGVVEYAIDRAQWWSEQAP